jgi:hypothetical protein
VIRFHLVPSVALAAVLAAPVGAQQAPTRAPTVRVFTVAGTATPAPPPATDRALAAELAAPTERPERAGTAATAQRAAALAELAGPRAAARPGVPGGIKPAAPGELEDVTLSTRRPWVDGQAYLTLLVPLSSGSGSGSVAFSPSYPGSAGVYFRAVAGRTYLLDFAVRLNKTGRFIVTAGAAEQQVEVAGGRTQQVLFAVAATADGWVNVWAKEPADDRHGWMLGDVRITRVP